MNRTMWPWMRRARGGGSACGEYNDTLVMTDVATAWNELRAVHNAAHMWVVATVVHLRHQLPFALRGIHSDNESAFITAQLTPWCVVEKTVFPRSRPRRANEYGQVEQKNWSAARPAVGDGRHADNAALLTRLYDVLWLYANYCMPVMKCIAKTWHGSRVTRHDDAALMPYARLLASAQVTKAEKACQRAIGAALNPVALSREITRLQALRARRARGRDTTVAYVSAFLLHDISSAFIFGATGFLHGRLRQPQARMEAPWPSLHAHKLSSPLRLLLLDVQPYFCRRHVIT